MKKKHEIRQEKEAKERGLNLLDHETKGLAKLYRFIECGHERYLQPGHVRNNNIRCRVCEINQYEKECLENGIEIIGHFVTENPNEKLIKFINCGHTRVANLQAAKKGEVKCALCQEYTYNQNALDAGCIFVDRLEDRRYGLYCLPCGHLNEIQHGNIKRKNFRCFHCSYSYMHRPSFVYCLKLSTKDENFIKIGFSQDIEKRKEQIQTEHVVISTIFYKEFENPKSSRDFERKLHSYLQKFKVSESFMQQFLKSGWTECFEYDSIHLLTNILKDDHEVVYVSDI